MAQRPQLLILSPYPTLPDNVGGKVRTVQLARNLARQSCDVTLIEPFAFGRSRRPSDEGITVQTVKYPFVIPFLLTDRPFPYQYLASFHPGYGFLLPRNLGQFDLVQFEHASFADLVDRLPPDTPVVYDAHNVEYDYVRSECSGRLARAVVAKRLFRLERKLVRRAALVLACSREDKRRFVDLYDVPEEKILVAPNGIREMPAVAARDETAPTELRSALGFPNRALFAGSDVEHNRKAVRFIVDTLAPALGSDCAFIIKGGCTNRFHYHGRKNVFVDRSPGSITPLAPICTVGITPVTQGGGTHLKVLDYLAHGLPVVSTEFGVRGYDDLREFITVCPLEAFQAELRRERRLSPAVNAALENYQWRAVAARVGVEYARLAAVARRPV